MISAEQYMTFVAFGALGSWFPQIARMIKTKSTDDFSLWTTAILMWANGSFLWWAYQIDDKPFMLQQILTMIMLTIFTGIILKYKSAGWWKM
tara:strand:+ start:545 stop:820 length:276 start_codon:yes stop_codon:yes gene_type:complete